ncbi:hypothetical protein D3C72_2034060 [compost metagenome]
MKAGVVGIADHHFGLRKEHVQHAACGVVLGQNHALAIEAGLAQAGCNRIQLPVQPVAIASLGIAQRRQHGNRAHQHQHGQARGQIAPCTPFVVACLRPTRQHP